MPEEWGRRLRRLGTGVTTSGPGLHSPGEDETLSRAPTKGDRDPGRSLNPPRIDDKIIPEAASEEMEEQNEAYTAFQHLNKMRWREETAGSSWDHFDTNPSNSHKLPSSPKQP